VTFRRDVVGHRLTTWLALLQRLVHRSVESDLFSIDSMYRDIIQPEVSVHSNNKKLENEDLA
jgi:hypothetical protein